VTPSRRVRAWHTDCEREFDEDESELNPERYAQNVVLTVLDAEALVLNTDEDGGNNVACTVEEVSIY